LFAPIFNY